MRQEQGQRAQHRPQRICHSNRAEQPTGKRLPRLLPVTTATGRTWLLSESKQGHTKTASGADQGKEQVLGEVSLVFIGNNLGRSARILKSYDAFKALLERNIFLFLRQNKPVLSPFGPLCWQNQNWPHKFFKEPMDAMSATKNKFY